MMMQLLTEINPLTKTMNVAHFYTRLFSIIGYLGSNATPNPGISLTSVHDAKLGSLSVYLRGIICR
jgi:hypothetical protein